MRSISKVQKAVWLHSYAFWVSWFQMFRISLLTIWSQISDTACCTWNHTCGSCRLVSSFSPLTPNSRWHIMTNFAQRISLLSSCISAFSKSWALTGNKTTPKAVQNCLFLPSLIRCSADVNWFQTNLKCGIFFPHGTADMGGVQRFLESSGPPGPFKMTVEACPLSSRVVYCGSKSHCSPTQELQRENLMGKCRIKKFRVTVIQTPPPLWTRVWDYVYAY